MHLSKKTEAKLNDKLQVCKVIIEHMLKNSCGSKYILIVNKIFKFCVKQDDSLLAVGVNELTHLKVCLYLPGGRTKWLPVPCSVRAAGNHCRSFHVVCQRWQV